MSGYVTGGRQYIPVPQMIIDAVKEVKDIPVGIRLSLYEDDPNGFDPSYGLKVAFSKSFTTSSMSPPDISEGVLPK